MATLERQRDVYRAAADEHQAVAAADARAAQVRTEVATPLIEQAAVDGTVYLTGREWMWEAEVVRARAGRLRKCAAGRAAAQAAGEHHATEDAVRRGWGSLSTGAADVEPWAATIARKQADAARA